MEDVGTDGVGGGVELGGEGEGDTVTYFASNRGGDDSQQEVEITEDDTPEEKIFKRMLALCPTKNYRQTVIGQTLKAALDELRKDNKLSDEMCDKALAQFDRTMLRNLGDKLKTRLTFKANKLDNYKYFGGVWTFDMTHVEFREVNSNSFSSATVPELKIVAFNGTEPDVERLKLLKILKDHRHRAPPPRPASAAPENKVDVDVNSVSVARGPTKSKGAARPKTAKKSLKLKATTTNAAN